MTAANDIGIGLNITHLMTARLSSGKARFLAELGQIGLSPVDAKGAWDLPRFGLALSRNGKSLANIWMVTLR